MAADAEALARIVAANRVDEVIVGLPYDMDGGEGAMALQARDWATAIAKHLDLPVRLRDERLSSHVAESRVGRRPAAAVPEVHPARCDARPTGPASTARPPP